MLENTKIKEKFQKSFLDKYYTKWKWRERKVSWGNEYPEKTFFVIRRAYCKVGLFSYVMTNMGLVETAIQKGYIPVIDMQNSKNTYLTDEKVCKENAWEYYFEQPGGYDLNDIRQAKNVILSSGLVTNKNHYPDFYMVSDENQFAYWHTFFQKHFKIKSEIVEKYQKVKEQLLGKKKTLGILARGTDYVMTKPKGHPVQPSASQIVEKATEMIDRCGCEKIYLATEDQQIFQTLQNHFGEKLVAMETRRYEATGNKNINDFRENRDKREEGENYLISMMILAGCDCLLAGNTGGTHGVLLMNQSYEDQYIFDLGVY